MNYAYLSSLFRKETGKSITQFKNELLIEKAITKLKNEAVNISEVSDDLGFSNPFYFSRVFKKVTGVSPTTYLNEIYRK
jgi:YesN/AraC family two-component response regulator